MLTLNRYKANGYTHGVGNTWYPLEYPVTHLSNKTNTGRDIFSIMFFTRSLHTHATSHKCLQLHDNCISVRFMFTNKAMLYLIEKLYSWLRRKLTTMIAGLAPIIASYLCWPHRHSLALQSFHNVSGQFGVSESLNNSLTPNWPETLWKDCNASECLCGQHRYDAIMGNKIASVQEVMNAWLLVLLHVVKKFLMALVI